MADGTGANLCARDELMALGVSGNFTWAHLRILSRLATDISSCILNILTGIRV